MPPRHIPSTLLLPILSLILFVTLVAIPATLSYLSLQQPASSPTRLDLPRQTLSPAETLRTIAASEPEAFANLLNGIDMPANFIELPIDRFLPSWPDTWTPAGIDVFAWRAITFPFLSLPFWWFAGFGLDALVRRRCPRWPVLLIGTILFAIFTVLAVGFSVSHGVEDDSAVTIPIVIGGFLWATLFAAFPATWIRNHLNRRTPHS